MRVLLNKRNRKEHTADIVMRDHLIISYAPFIKLIAKKIAVHLPSSVDLDDLVSAGVIGLIDAISKYDPQRKNLFKTYAEFRIRGAIFDELRSQDWVPRSVRESLRKVANTNSVLEQRFGRSATELEMAEELDVSLAAIQNINKTAVVLKLTSLDVGPTKDLNQSTLLSQIEDTAEKGPLNHLILKSHRECTAALVSDLPDNQRLVVALYYIEELSLKEIGVILDVSESRVSQIHKQAIKTLRLRIRPKK